MQLPDPPKGSVPHRMPASGADGLDDHHRDPFDRMPVFQAALRKLPNVAAEQILDCQAPSVGA